MTKVDMTLAWIDENGRVVWVETTPLNKYVAYVPQNGAGGFEPIFVQDAEVAPHLHELEMMKWVVGQ